MFDEHETLWSANRRGYRRFCCQTCALTVETRSPLAETISASVTVSVVGIAGKNISSTIKKSLAAYQRTVLWFLVTSPASHRHSTCVRLCADLETFPFGVWYQVGRFLGNNPQSVVECVPLFRSITHRKPLARQRQVPLKLTRGKFAVSSIMEARAVALKQDAPRQIEICMNGRPAGRWMIPRGPRARDRRYACPFGIKSPSNRVYDSESALIFDSFAYPKELKSPIALQPFRWISAGSLK